MQKKIFIIKAKVNEKYILCGEFSKNINKNIGRFQYYKEYIENPNAYPIDPENLPLQEQEFFTSQNKGYFGIFYDMLPQGWNKLLLEQEVKDEISLNYVVLNDLIKIDESFPYKSTITKDEISNYIEKIVKPFSKTEKINPKKQKTFGAISCLHGVRPKVFVEDNNKIYIAKFSQEKDEFDNPLVEYCMFKLAEKCGITIPHIFIEKINNENVLFSEYFVKNSIFLSLGTLLQEKNPMLIEQITKVNYDYEDAYKLCDNPEIFKRIVFNIATKNMDDHLWNTGFLWNGTFLELSPMYDMNPFPSPTCELCGCIKDSNNTPIYEWNSLEEVLVFAQKFNNTIENLLPMLNELKQWKKLFLEYGVSQKDIKTLEQSFSIIEKFK